MIDIHSHILPGIDDGAATQEDALAMLMSAQKAGVTRIVATPHILDWSDEAYLERIKDVFRSMKTLIRERDIRVELILGAEILISHDLSLRLEKNSEFTLGGNKRYVLMELPFMEIPIYFEDVIFELKTKGITPVIAHVERYYQIIKHPEYTDKIINSGALIQSNAGSFSGKYGRSVRRTAVRLLKKGKIHIIASDSHGLSKQGEYVNSKGMKTVKKMVSDQAFDCLVNQNPGLVIGNEPHNG